jgi:hypothetical protein
LFAEASVIDEVFEGVVAVLWGFKAIFVCFLWIGNGTSAESGVLSRLKKGRKKAGRAVLPDIPLV